MVHLEANKEHSAAGRDTGAGAGVRRVAHRVRTANRRVSKRTRLFNEMMHVKPVANLHKCFSSGRSPSKLTSNSKSRMPLSRLAWLATMRTCPPNSTTWASKEEDEGDDGAIEALRATVPLSTAHRTTAPDMHTAPTKRPPCTENSVIGGESVPMNIRFGCAAVTASIPPPPNPHRRTNLSPSRLTRVVSLTIQNILLPPPAPRASQYCETRYLTTETS